MRRRSRAPDRTQSEVSAERRNLERMLKSFIRKGQELLAELAAGSSLQRVDPDESGRVFLRSKSLVTHRPARDHGSPPPSNFTNNVQGTSARSVRPRSHHIFRFR